jgi:hypothetical protein
MVGAVGGFSTSPAQPLGLGLQVALLGTQPRGRQVRDALSAQGCPDEGERLGDESRLLALCQRAQGATEEDREPMDAGPRRVLDVGATSGRQNPGVNEVVEGRLQMVERSRLVGSLTGLRMVGGRECGVEEAGLRAGKVKVCVADGPEPASRACRCVRPRTYLAHPFGHALSERSDRLVADRREERITVAEVPICGVRNDPDHARHLAQHYRVRAPRSSQLEASLDERRPDSAAWTRAPAPRWIARVRPSRGSLIACWHFARP